MLSLSSKQNPVFPFAFVRLLFALVMMLGASALLPNLNSAALAQRTSGPLPRAFPTTIQWNKQKGVSKYRLQIADDEDFSNVFYDGRVMGERYMVTGLAPGYYYWRIAPAGSQTGAFLKPVRFFVSGGVVVSGMPPGSPGTRPKSPAMPTSKVR